MHWWRELHSERRQRVIQKGPRFVGWHNLEIFALPPRERSRFYLLIKDVWKDYENARALGVLTPIVFLYLTERVKTGTELERSFLEKVLEVAFDVLVLGAFLCSVRYGPVERLAFPRMVDGCDGNGVLLRVSLSSVKLWYRMGILWLIRNMEVDTVLAFVAVGRVAEVDRDGFND